MKGRAHIRGDLDSLNTAIVMQLLVDLNEQDNISLIMVTHDVGS